VPDVFQQRRTNDRFDEQRRRRIRQRFGDA
jgi:hypothetical protein